MDVGHHRRLRVDAAVRARLDLLSERYDYAAAIQALARSMASLLDLEEITRRLTSTIESVMHARNPRLAVGTPAAALVAAFGVAPGALSRLR